MHSTAAVTRRVLAFRGEDGSVATRMADVVPAIRAHLASGIGSHRARAELFMEALPASAKQRS